MYIRPYWQQSKDKLADKALNLGLVSRSAMYILKLFIDSRIYKMKTILAMVTMIYVILTILGHTQVTGLTCLICNGGEEQPRHCRRVVECADGEVCSLERERRTDEFGMSVYNLGCMLKSNCHNTTGSGSYCSQCCSTDLCNNEGCEEPGYPASRGPTCYNCPSPTTVGKCHDIDHCQQGEVCVIKGWQEFGDDVFTSRCASPHECDTSTGAIIGKRNIDVSVRSHEVEICNRCCAEDLCNRDCNITPTPTTTSIPLTTSTPPPTSTPPTTLTPPTTSTPPTTTTQSPLHVPTDCVDVYNMGNTDSGVYTISTWKSHTTLQVFCDMGTPNGGWTVFQKRYDGSVDFYRNFTEYENGFGNIEGEFWLGLKYVQEMAGQGHSVLLLNMTDSDGKHASDSYNNFSLSPPTDYTLHIGDNAGSFGMSSNNTLVRHKNSAFSTYDHVNSRRINFANCAETFHGAFWYTDCYSVNLNGRYLTPGAHGSDGMVNNGIASLNIYVSLKSSAMMFRRV